MNNMQEQALAHLKAIAERFTPRFECCTPVVEVVSPDATGNAAVAESLLRIGAEFQQSSERSLHIYSLSKLSEMGVPMPHKEAFIQAMEQDIARISGLDVKSTKLLRRVAEGELNGTPVSGGWHRAVQLHTFGAGASDEKEPAVRFLAAKAHQFIPEFLDERPIVICKTQSKGQSEAMQQALTRLGVSHHDSGNYLYVLNPEKLHEAGVKLPDKTAFAKRLHDGINRSAREAALEMLFRETTDKAGRSR